MRENSPRTIGKEELEASEFPRVCEAKGALCDVCVTYHVLRHVKQ